jgi:hypothetical protein
VDIRTSPAHSATNLPAHCLASSDPSHLRHPLPSCSSQFLCRLLHHTSTSIPKVDLQHIAPENAVLRSHTTVKPSPSHLACALMSSATFDRLDRYTVGWISALPVERAAAVAMLDENHADPAGLNRHPTDTNIYDWGRMAEHNVVVTALAAGRISIGSIVRDTNRNHQVLATCSSTIGSSDD